MSTGRKGAKAGGPQYRDPGGKPEKGKQPPTASPAGSVVKGQPDAIAVRTLPTGEGYKGSAAAFLQVPAGRGPKQAAPAQPGADKTLRMRFTMMASGEVRLDSAVLIDGAPVTPTNRVVGPMLYAFRKTNGALAAFGTFEDPLVEHSYLQEDGKHGESRAKEGSFGISLQGTMAREALQGVTIQFYSVQKMALPAVLDEKAFTAAIRKASRLKDVSAGEVVRVMRQVSQ